MRTQFLVSMALAVVTATTDHKLKFGEDGTFKLMQFTDLHFGEGDATDEQNESLMKQLLDAEKPDIVANTGDVVSGHLWDGTTKPWAATYWSKMANTIQDAGYYWASTAGNNDGKADLTREQIHELDMSFDNAMTLPNAAAISNSFNYVLPVYDAAGENVVMRLWFLDSGDQDCLGVEGFGCVHPDQVKWFREENDKIPATDPSKGKGMLFMHIPLVNYRKMYNDFPWYGNAKGQVSCQAVDTGVFGAILEQASVGWVVCGHDHDNDFYGSYNGIHLAYGRKTGYGDGNPAAPMTQGARVFQVTQKDDDFTIETYVRESTGNIVTETKKKKRRIDQRPQLECVGVKTTGETQVSLDEEWYYMFDQGSFLQ